MKSLSANTKVNRDNLCDFYLVVLPGFETEAAMELECWCPEISYTLDLGGLSFRAPLDLGLSLNQCLKTPTRILLRVADFRCRDFPKLYKKLKSLDWDKWIPRQSELSIQVSSRRSRLSIKSRIEKTALDAWRDFSKSQTKPNLKHTVYIRFSDDQCVVSLDTSGDPLYKRGYRTHIGEAPLRENIAAGLWWWITLDIPIGEGIDLVDPMMGTGVFLQEALLCEAQLSARPYAFDSFVSPEVRNLSPVSRNFGLHLTGFERNPKVLALAEMNLAQNLDMKLGGVRLMAEDFLAHSKSQPKAEGSTRLILCNPPYGERLKISGDIKEYYEKLMQACENRLCPDRAGFIFPTSVVKSRLKLPSTWKVLGKKPFSNGGIPVTAIKFHRTV